MCPILRTLFSLPPPSDPPQPRDFKYDPCVFSLNAKRRLPTVPMVDCHLPWAPALTWMSSEHLRLSMSPKKLQLSLVPYIKFQSGWLCLAENVKKSAHLHRLHQYLRGITPRSALLVLRHVRTSEAFDSNVFHLCFMSAAVFGSAALPHACAGSRTYGGRGPLIFPIWGVHSCRREKKSKSRPGDGPSNSHPLSQNKSHGQVHGQQGGGVYSARGRRARPGMQTPVTLSPTFSTYVYSPHLPPNFTLNSGLH